MKTNPYVQFLCSKTQDVTKCMLQTARWLGKSLSVYLGRTEINVHNLGFSIQYTTASAEMCLERCTFDRSVLKKPPLERYLYKRSNPSLARPKLTTANNVKKVDEEALRHARPIVAKILFENPFLIESYEFLDSIASSVIRNIWLKHPTANGNELKELAKEEMLGVNAEQYRAQAGRLMLFKNVH